jgi:hypothetical protein
LRRVLDAAREVAAEPALVAELVASTGLSEAGVRLALAEHLELDATDAELEALRARVTKASRVHVILSANVFVGALRALVLARAASAHVTVRPSRREPVFATALVKVLGDPAVTLSEEEPSEGEIHVYGRDETIEALRARTSLLVRGHGTGMGVAYVPGGVDMAAAAARVASDVVPFDQRGCLSPRIVFVEDGPETFADDLAEALAARELAVPRGALTPAERAELERWADSVAFAGSLRRGPAWAVAVAGVSALPPPGRHVVVVPWAGARTLEPIARWVVAVGAPTLEAARLVAPPHARIALLGEMQKPRLDGPVDLR